MRKLSPVAGMCFFEHTVLSRGLELPVWAGDTLLSVSKVQWNVLGEVTKTLCLT
jgi:hypothetical protein